MIKVKLLGLNFPRNENSHIRAPNGAEFIDQAISASDMQGDVFRSELGYHFVLDQGLVLRVDGRSIAKKSGRPSKFGATSKINLHVQDDLISALKAQFPDHTSLSNLIRKALIHAVNN